MLNNPVFLSVVLMLLLCFARFNVFLAILISGLFAGVFSDFMLDKYSDFGGLIDSLLRTMDGFIAGMSGNLETSLSYILVGALAASVARSNLSGFLVAAFSKYLSSKKAILLASIAFFSCFSQNLIPIHIAFIPILIPPLAALFKKINLDRRAIACAITFGITTPYVALPLGFGLIFQGIVAREISKSGLEVSLANVSASAWLIAPVMLAGLLGSMIFYGLKKGVWQDIAPQTDTPKSPLAEKCASDEGTLKPSQKIKFSRKDAGVLAGLIVTMALQITLKNLPLSSLAGFLIVVLSGGIKYKNLNEIFGEGFALMGYVAFIMLVAAGFGAILRSTGAIEQIVEFVVTCTDNKLAISFGMMCAGLLITLGIGSSFGTVPIIATIFVPICQQLGFSSAGIIFIIAAAGFIGDTGSPASETTLGVQVGINADGAACHIRDVCIPTMLFYNLPLLLAGALIPIYL